MSTITVVENDDQHARVEPLPHLAILDGWRAISILLVLAAHMLPLGPKALRLNETAAYMGMAVFFTLSGFLITQQLQQRRDVGDFFIRRFFRIIPLAYLAILFAAWFTAANRTQLLVNLLFAQTYVQSGSIPALAHFWSLCVELQFYVLIGLLMWATRFRGFSLLPVLWGIALCARMWTDASGTIETHARVDEILSGSLLALLYRSDTRALGRVPLWTLCIAFLLTCHPWTAALHAGRGLVASCLVGRTLLAAGPRARTLLTAKPMLYVAGISYALYVVHPLTMLGGLGEGATPVAKYAKRLLCLALTFGVAHLSTTYYEHPFIRWAKSLSAPTRSKARSRAASNLGV